MVDRNLRSTVRPAAPQGKVHTKPELIRLFCDEPQVIDKLVREKRQILDSGSGVVERKRIYRLYLKAADTRSLHLEHLAFEFRFGHSGAKPPPAHHDAARVGRGLEEVRELGHV